MSEGVIIISLLYHIEEEKKLLIAYTIMFLVMILLTGIMILLIISFAVGRLRRPIKKLLQHTSEVDPGGFSKITIDTSDSELRRLVENFNALIDRYDYLIETDNRKYSRINTLLSNLKTGILMVDTDNKVTLVNPEAEKLLKLNKLHLFGVRSIEKIENDILTKILDHTSLISPGNPGTSFSEFTGDGEIIDITVEMMVDKYAPYAPGGALVILRDVTEIRRLEKLKDEFVSNVSHELRTPLTVISGFVETLKSWDLLDTGDRSTALNIIEVETERLKKLISELLLLCRIEGEMGHARKRLINIPENINQVMTTLGPLAKKKNLKVMLDCPETPPPLFGIPGWFRQIIYNLYDNAVKYTPDGGSIWIRLSDSGGILSLEVEDTGTGIPEEERTKIFERFYRRDKSRNSRISGSGIGLTITSHMVTEFGGTISVEGRAGGGSIFRIEFPRDRNNTDRSTFENET